MLTEVEIAEFKRLVLEIYGIKLTDTQVLDQGSRLITLYELMLKHKINNGEGTLNYRKKMVQNNE